MFLSMCCCKPPPLTHMRGIKAVHLVNGFALWNERKVLNVDGSPWTHAAEVHPTLLTPSHGCNKYLRICFKVLPQVSPLNSAPRGDLAPRTDSVGSVKKPSAAI